MIEVTSRIGLRVYRKRTLSNGAPSKLFVITREEALKSTPYWPGSAMIGLRPRFGFTPAEQKLLELALLDHSDRDAAAGLHLSTAIKKGGGRFTRRLRKSSRPSCRRSSTVPASAARCCKGFATIFRN
jgi:hypothetical protein